MDWTKFYSIPRDIARDWGHVILSGIMIQLYLQLFALSLYHEQGRDNLFFDIHLVLIMIATFGAISLARSGEQKSPTTKSRPLSLKLLISKWTLIAICTCFTLFLVAVFWAHYLKYSEQMIANHRERFYAPAVTFTCFVLVGLYQDQWIAALWNSVINWAFLFFAVWKFGIVSLATGFYISVVLLGIYYTVALYRVQASEPEPGTELEQPKEQINQDKPDTYITLENNEAV